MASRKVFNTTSHDILITAKLREKDGSKSPGPAFRVRVPGAKLEEVDGRTKNVPGEAMIDENVLQFLRKTRKHVEALFTTGKLK